MSSLKTTVNAWSSVKSCGTSCPLPLPQQDWWKALSHHSASKDGNRASGDMLMPMGEEIRLIESLGSWADPDSDYHGDDLLNGTLSVGLWSHRRESQGIYQDGNCTVVTVRRP